MGNVDIEQEKKKKFEFDRIYRAQEKIRKEFVYLEDVDNKLFQAQFVQTQAKEICNYLNRLKLMPFKAWETLILDKIRHEDTDFEYQFYIIKNEYGTYVPDFERIKLLILEDADPEEFPESKR